MKANPIINPRVSSAQGAGSPSINGSGLNHNAPCTPQTSSQFPPALINKDASSWRIFDAPTLQQAALSHPRCQKISDAWPRLVERSEAALRVSNPTQFYAAVAKVQQSLKTFKEMNCPEWQGLLDLQTALLEEHKGLHAPTHAADQATAWKPTVAIAFDTDIVRKNYIATHDNACLNAAQHMSIAADMWCQGAAEDDVATRRQRYVLNLVTDETLVHVDGGVGGTCEPNQFVALGEIEGLRPDNSFVASLQGQGPVTDDAKKRYFEACLAYAKRRLVEHLVFVNAAEGDNQIPSFAADIDQLQSKARIHLSYFGSINWADGSLTTPLGAAHFAAAVVSSLREKPRPAAVVVNCNAGLDRSGITNILIRCISELEDAHLRGTSWPAALALSFSRVAPLVAQLKQVRPHAISSWGRNLFIYQALDAYVQERIAKTPSRSLKAFKTLTKRTYEGRE